MLLMVSVVYFFCLPAQLFHAPYSTVLLASDGALLSASIARDGQWRFPQEDSVPEKFTKALIAFEDKRFRDHPGVDVLSLGRAIRQNLKSGKVVSGGSTITMQVIRLSRQNQSRNIFEKCIEIILATRLELRSSKEEILSLYAAHAPFGGNVVGLEAACWRYFGVSPRNLSWGEAAMLAVLPNAPSLIHPGKNREILKSKRDRLLTRLQAIGVIDSLTCSLAREESIPEEPRPLPRLAKHLLDRIASEGLSQKKILSTVGYDLQQRVESILHDHHERLRNNRILNAAALVLEVSTGNVLAYAGNVPSGKESGEEVDVIRAPRSTGSILKPFLYAAMLDEGKILPKTLLPDVPVLINGFAPKNFSHQYDGAVPADQALIRSLNIPAVHLLREYHYEKFYQLLKDAGMTTLSHPSDHYGLSLILGGAEGTLWDITGMYASMARTLNNYFGHPGRNRYSKRDFHPPRYIARAEKEIPALEETSWINAASVYTAFEALKEVYRPSEEAGWKLFSSSRQIAWKTGTSFGFRDGWAVGVTPEYAIGVWVGNASGEGRPGLTGVDAAAPVLFDIFSRFSGTTWFQKPQMEMRSIATCHKSGYRASANCDQKDTVSVPVAGLETTACPYHKTVHVTPDLKFRLHSECAPVTAMKHTSWFVLPPVQEFYYKFRNSGYRALPPFRPDCQPSFSVTGMEMIYPKPNAKIFVPRDIDGSPGSAVFEVAHRNPAITVYWHLDGTYIGSTKKVHHLPLNPVTGKHILTLIDETGESIERHFEVISKM